MSTRHLPPSPAGLSLGKDELVVVGEGLPPEGKGWLSEVKIDGWRLAILTDGKGGICLQTRSGQDRTWDFISPVRGLANCGHAAIIDGEIAVPDEAGITHLDPLHKAMRSHDSDCLVYYAFDLLHCDGADLRRWPVEKRKEALRGLLKPMSLPRLLFVDHVFDAAPRLFAAAGKLGCEGIVSKRTGSPYEGGSRPSTTWLKSICAGMERANHINAPRRRTA